VVIAGANHVIEPESKTVARAKRKSGVFVPRVAFPLTRIPLPTRAILQLGLEDTNQTAATASLINLCNTTSRTCISPQRAARNNNTVHTSTLRYRGTLQYDAKTLLQE